MQAHTDGALEYRPLTAYLGGYTEPDRHGRGAGIAVYHVGPNTGAWSPVQTVAGEQNPSFLALDPQQRFLYAVHGGNASQVSAFAVDPQDGRLTLLNRQPSHGANPVYPAIDVTGHWLVLANYTGQSIAAYPLGEDGRLGEATDVVVHTGPLGPNPARQDTPHPHQITWDAAGRFLFVPDLGLDRTYIYRLSDAGRFVAHEPAFVASPPGSGPRHIAFHPSNTQAYLLHEMGNLLTTFAYDADRGLLDPRQSISTIPPDYAATTTAAEVAVAPSGRFVYASNRGHDSMAVFAVDQADGTLTPAEWVPTQGRTPRHFALDPSGRFLYAENQDSDTIITFQIDEATGRLTPTGQVIAAGSPACIVFAGG